MFFDGNEVREMTFTARLNALDVKIKRLLTLGAGAVVIAALVASHGSLVHLRRDISRGLSALTVLLLARTVLAIVEYTMFNV